jgi:hypothetical protein
MTIKEAILKSLGDLKVPSSYSEVYNQICSKGYHDFKDAKTPLATVSGILSRFIFDGDTRVNRVKISGGYLYVLTENVDTITSEIVSDSKVKSSERSASYDERDLHKLLSSYLKSIGIYSKTIFHEQSKNSSDSNQIWTHPDIVGIRFLKLHTKTSQSFLKSISRIDTFKISSYELKKEINSDSELKKAFFQAVSNSSWANYGYLVAHEISSSLFDEIERLNQSFGIGVIELKANPYQSKVLFQPRLRELDFKTIDKLCKINKDFDKFIEQVDKYMTAEDRYHKALEKELDEFCDDYFADDSEVERYCKEKSIPID